MNTLLLRLSGAMQSWGVQSQFGVRDTGLEPSKSGVLGLVCAAMGIQREDDAGLEELARLQMGIRADREGYLSSDYHTAQNVLRAKGGIKETELSNRYYLADAIFLVGLAAPDLSLLERVHAALRNPTWPIFLGRKAFVPGETVWLVDGLCPGKDLQKALENYPCLTSRPSSERLRLILEDPENGTIVRNDQPLSFALDRRRFVPRRLTVTFTDCPAFSPEGI